MGMLMTIQVMKLQDIPSPSQAARNQALRMYLENTHRILGCCEELGWLWSNNNKPGNIPEIIELPDNGEWWLYLGRTKGAFLFWATRLYSEFNGYEIDLNKTSPTPVLTDICKQCGGFGRIMGMACICDNCGNLIWGC